MTILRIFVTGVFVIVISCAKPATPVNIEFEGQSFELPIRVIEAKEKLGLEFGEYEGFYKANGPDRIIETQLQYFPLFMGRDHLKEESYYNESIVGVTFFKKGTSIG